MCTNQEYRETRLIEPRDAEALRTLRIRAVKEYPSAFAASVEEETGLSIDEVAKQLSDGHPYAFWRGAFDISVLIGMLHLFRYQRPKVNHKLMLGGMYIVREHQKQGIGRMLLEDTISLLASQLLGHSRMWLDGLLPSTPEALLAARETAIIDACLTRTDVNYNQYNINIIIKTISFCQLFIKKY